MLRFSGIEINKKPHLYHRRMRLLRPGPLSSLLEDLNSVLLPLKSGGMFVTAPTAQPRRGTRS
jgi:hypothetical protein